MISQQSISGAISKIATVEVAQREATLVSFMGSNGMPFSWEAIAQGLVHSDEFRRLWSQTWADLPFDFEWKPVPIHPYTAKTHPFFAIAFPARFRPANASSFYRHLQQLGPEQLVADFFNLSGDAQLLIPTETGAYGHIAAFCRIAPAAAQAALWQRMGELCTQAIANSETVWCNTHGHGVPWLHIRFDSRLKYASFPPRGAINANSQAVWYERIYAQVQSAAVNE